MLLAAPVWAMTKIVIPVAATSDMIEEYNALSHRTQLEPFNKDYELAGLDTCCITGLIIIKNALALRGIDAQFRFLEVPNIRREADEVAKGNAAIGSHLFNDDTTGLPRHYTKMYLKTSIAQNISFDKGIYCLPNNKKILSARTSAELKQRGKALIGLHWDKDYTILTQMGITPIERAPSTESMFKMLQAGRADWIPLEFSTAPDKSITHAGVRLVPVPGIKISLSGERHFILSKRHPHGKLIYREIEEGMKIMRRQGLMQKILGQEDLSCKDINSWRTLNQTKTDEEL